MKIKVMKVEIMVIDFDELGEDGVRSMIENARYPNRAISPEVKNIESKEIDWTDEHPLNMIDKSDSEYKKLFGGE